MDVEYLRASLDLSEIKPSDQRLQALLEEGERQTLRDGVAKNHSDRTDLLVAYVGLRLEQAGIIKGGVASQQIGDVSITYHNDEATSYKGRYLALLQQIRGLKDRL